jgi:hypothetical protein
MRDAARWPRRVRAFRTQLFFSFGAITLIAATLGFLLVYATSLTLVKRQLAAASRQRMVQAQFSIESINTIFSDFSKVIMQDPDVLEAITPHETNLARVEAVSAANRKLMVYVNSYRAIHSIYILGANRIVLGISRSRIEWYSNPALPPAVEDAVPEARNSVQRVALRAPSISGASISGSTTRSAT